MVVGRHWGRQLLGLLHACTVAWPVHSTGASAGAGTGTIPVVAVPMAVPKAVAVAVAVSQHVAAGVCGTQH